MRHLGAAWSPLAIGAIGCATALLAARQPGSDQRPLFTSGVRTVAVYATVHGRDGHLAPNLARSDFQILDNGRPVEITTFSNEAVPFTVALMLDMSASMAAELERVRGSAIDFVQALSPDDRVTIGTFGDEVALSPLLTGDKPTLLRILKEELWLGGGTPLWTAMDRAMSSLATESGRRVILALTDGDDECILGRRFGSQRDFCAVLPDVRRIAFERDFMSSARMEHSCPA